MACRQATGGRPSSGVELGGKSGLVRDRSSVGALLGVKISDQSTDIDRPAAVSKPIGDWPERWADYTHELGRARNLFEA